MADSARRPDRRRGEWITHSTLREIYSSRWVTLRIDDVERPDGSHIEHEVVRGRDAAAMVVLDPTRGVLMIWRHRFLTDTWGWEIPGGAVDARESPEAAARRECLEETGWAATGDVRHLTSYHPSVGLVSQTFHIFETDRADRIGGPTDLNEAVVVDWRPLETVAEDIRSGTISDGFTQLGVTLAMARAGHGHLL
jgi:8-oxo-dGTP pyrophosphatase MutT (NUDIX family)